VTADVNPNEIEIDLDALEKKYAEERAKRMRTDGVDQFQEMKGKLADFGKDPHADPDFKRDPIVEEVDVVVIGGGFGGLLASGRLRERGVDNFKIIERGADFGGTWYWNRYPGAACDVESYIYMPMLEELGYVPTEKYAKGVEIYQHCQRLARHYDLYSRALFQTSAEKAQWDEKAKRWLISTDRGDKISTRFVVSCLGLLSTPKLPKIPGIQDFQGHTFHTSRWDYDYTGGDQTGGLTGLSDKKIGFIGTGSTGIQAIPVLGQYAGHLNVFQRTPSTIDPRGNHPTDYEWASKLKPGWQLERRNNFVSILAGGHEDIDMVDDGWTAIVKGTAGPGVGADENADPNELKKAEFRKTEAMRQRIGRIVKDPATAEALKPYYSYFCKRPCFHDEYLETFNRPNVTLVDTKGKGVERITRDGVVVDGKEYKLDCLIYGTGFEWLADYGSEFGIDIVGPGGVNLGDHWKEGPRTLYGMQTHGFPNYFFQHLIQAAGSSNYVHTADEQGKHISYTIAECLKRGIETVQPTKAAEESWIEEVVTLGGPRRAFIETCTPGYYNFEGNAGRVSALNEFWCGNPLEYNQRLQEWRAAGALADLETT
jgi:cyclohexanone monooxygenase